MTDPETAAESRQEQIYPTLSAAEIERLLPLGVVQSFERGDLLARVGQLGLGLAVVLSGSVDIIARDAFADPHHVTAHEAGSVLGEMAQLSGRPALFEAVAATRATALILSPEAVRQILVLEAELGERIMRALILRRVQMLASGYGGPVIVGSAGDPDVRRLETFLTRSGHPMHRLDPAGDPLGAELATRLAGEVPNLPFVVCPDGHALVNPSDARLAQQLGLVPRIDPAVTYDLVVVGAGPAGLAASVYAASEGLKVLTVECRTAGGQAGASARIENYLGFPTGISGQALMGRALAQAQKFGAEMVIPGEGASLRRDGDGVLRVRLTTGCEVGARTAVIASGARYRTMALEGLSEFEARCVHYWASPVEARLAVGEEVVLVGGGNSAGQAAAYLAAHAARITLLVRRQSLAATMSKYLIDRLEALPNLDIVHGVEAVELEGRAGKLEAVLFKDVGSGSLTRRPARHLFLFVGADPNSAWLRTCGAKLDARGFVLTGDAAGAPRALETSLPGVFAIGDVRSGSEKRVAAAVGEGAQAVAGVHGYLATLRAAVARETSRGPPAG